MIIDESHKVALFHPSAKFHHWAMHNITLPHIVGQFGFKLAAIFGLMHGSAHQVLLMQKTVNRGIVQCDARSNQLTLVHLFDKLGHGGSLIFQS